MSDDRRERLTAETLCDRISREVLRHGFNYNDGDFRCYCGIPAPESWDQHLAEALAAVFVPELTGLATRAEKAEAENERLQVALTEASDALCAVGKAALVVAPTLAKPYPDAPKTSPWQQFMERPVRDAYNLGKRIRRDLRETRDAR